MERKNAWAAYAEDDGKVEAFAKAYCDFINNGKTERECVARSWLRRTALRI